MKPEIIEALALELTKIKIANKGDTSSIDASLLIGVYLESLNEIKQASKSASKGLNINPNILDIM